MKGTNIFINEDLCESSLEKRKNQLPELQKAGREGKIAYFSHTRLVVRERINTGQLPHTGREAASIQQKSSDPAPATRVTTPEETDPSTLRAGSTLRNLQKLPTQVTLRSASSAQENKSSFTGAVRKGKK